MGRIMTLTPTLALSTRKQVFELSETNQLPNPSKLSEKEMESLYRCECGIPPLNGFVVPERMEAIICSNSEPRQMDLEIPKEFYTGLANDSSFTASSKTTSSAHLSNQ